MILILFFAIDKNSKYNIRDEEKRSIWMNPTYNTVLNEIEINGPTMVLLHYCVSALG